MKNIDADGVDKQQQKKNENRICGIDPEDIENKKDYESLINDMRCPMCLNVVLKPLECKKCQALICENCYLILSLADLKCVTPNCEGDYEKANKFIREILCALKITCRACNQKNLNYENYIKHIDKCPKFLASPVMKMISDIDGLDQQINQVNKSITQFHAHHKLTDEQIKAQLITQNLDDSGKLELYQVCVRGTLQNFKHLIEFKGYSLLEEISSKDFGWTSLHYAMHYGRMDIAFYMLDLLNSKGQLLNSLRLRSSDGRTPILCLLKSNALTNERKKELLEALLNKYRIPLEEDVSLELTGRGMENLKNLFTHS